MNSKSTSPLVLSYFLLVVIELFAELIAGLNGSVIPIYVSKPLLMPLLMVIVYKSVQKPIANLYKLILAALFFSWFGDIFLMIRLPEVNLFLFGLGSFLVAHLFYIAAFRKVPNTRITKNIAFAPVLIALYGFGLVYGLSKFGNEAFQEMKIPVIMYATVILLMAIAAVYRVERTNIKSFQWVLFGAILFVLSDSMIALGRFSSTFVNYPNVARVLIMLTYTVGQYFIVKGAIQQSDKSV